MSETCGEPLAWHPLTHFPEMQEARCSRCGKLHEARRDAAMSSTCTAPRLATWGDAGEIRLAPTTITGPGPFTVSTEELRRLWAGAAPARPAAPVLSESAEILRQVREAAGLKEDDGVSLVWEVKRLKALDVPCCSYCGAHALRRPDGGLDPVHHPVWCQLETASAGELARHPGPILPVLDAREAARRTQVGIAPRRIAKGETIGVRLPIEPERPVVVYDETAPVPRSLEWGPGIAAKPPPPADTIDWISEYDLLPDE